MLSVEEVDCQPVLTGWAKPRGHARIPARCTAIAGLYQLISQYALALLGLSAANFREEGHDIPSYQERVP